MVNKFKRVVEHSAFGGVCAGIAYFIGIQTWIIRLIFFLLAIYGDGLGVMVIIYILLWIFAPAWETTPDDYGEICQ